MYDSFIFQPLLLLFLFMQPTQAQTNPPADRSLNNESML